MANEVKVFEKFRDLYLLSNRFGKSMVSFYYKHSPKLAKFILNKPFLRIVTIIGLFPVAKLCELMLPPTAVDDLLANTCDRSGCHSSHCLGLPGPHKTYPTQRP